MRRLFYPGELTPEIRITGGDAYHLARVMRAQLGDVHVVAGADGRAARMTVTAVARDAVTLRLDSYVEDDAPARAEVILVQALLKGEKTDFVVQKAVELGAAALHPIVTEHVVRIGVLNGEHMRVLGVIAVDGVSTNHAQNNSHAKGPGYGRGGINQREDNE